MSPYGPEVVTLWAVQSPEEAAVLAALEFGFDEEGKVIPSPFARAFRSGRYDDDFANAAFRTRGTQPLAGGGADLPNTE